MPCPLHFFRHPDPSRLKTERIQFLAQNHANVFNTLLIQGAAIDIDQSFKQINGVFNMGLTPGYDCLFIGIQ
jgi:hypothetical protein